MIDRALGYLIAFALGLGVGYLIWGPAPAHAAPASPAQQQVSRVVRLERAFRLQQAQIARLVDVNQRQQAQIATLQRSQGDLSDEVGLFEEYVTTCFDHVLFAHPAKDGATVIAGEPHTWVLSMVNPSCVDGSSAANSGVPNGKAPLVPLHLK